MDVTSNYRCRWELSILPATNQPINSARSTKLADPLPAQAQEVPLPTPTLPAYLVGKLALVGSAPDFEADALRRGGYPRFGAELAPLSHVVGGPLPLPAGAGPHLPIPHGR